MPGPTYTAAEVDKKKVEISAVIDFCNANGFKDWSKPKIFKFFEVPYTTGLRWFPASSTPTDRRTQQPADTATGSLSVSSTSHQQSPPPKRQNPVRNGGRDRKRLKSMIEDVSDVLSPPPLDPPGSSKSSSPPQPQSPLTPPKRKIAQPRKKTGLYPGRQLKYEETMIKEEGMDDEITV